MQNSKKSTGPIQRNELSLGKAAAGRTAGPHRHKTDRGLSWTSASLLFNNPAYKYQQDGSKKAMYLCVKIKSGYTHSYKEGRRRNMGRMWRDRETGGLKKRVLLDLTDRIRTRLFVLKQCWEGWGVWEVVEMGCGHKPTCQVQFKGSGLPWWLRTHVRDHIPGPQWKLKEKALLRSKLQGRRVANIPKGHLPPQ